MVADKLQRTTNISLIFIVSEDLMDTATKSKFLQDKKGNKKLNDHLIEVGILDVDLHVCGPSIPRKINVEVRILDVDLHGSSFPRKTNVERNDILKQCCSGWVPVFADQDLMTCW
ncbi:hypothetical protein ACROYT_G039305 [Oculina patagonica]